MKAYKYFLEPIWLSNKPTIKHWQRHLNIISKAFSLSILSLEQLRAFLGKMQDDQDLRQEVLNASTADDVAKIAAGLGYEFSGDELLRVSGKKMGRVTVHKQNIPGEYN
jgi:predicted ribosomally synthesized peptide with nif11-like leader